MRKILTSFPYLLNEASLLRARIQLLEDELYSVCITASLSGMPFGGQMSNPTAQAGILCEERDEIRKEIEELKTKAQAIEAQHLHILSTLRILTKAEAEVVWARSIAPQRSSWAEVARRLEPKRSIRWWQMQYNTGISRFEDLGETIEHSEEIDDFAFQSK